MKENRFLSRVQAFEASEIVGRNPSGNPTLGDVIAARFRRRDLLKGALGVAAIAAALDADLTVGFGLGARHIAGGAFSGNGSRPRPQIERDRDQARVGPLLGR